MLGNGTAGRGYPIPGHPAQGRSAEGHPAHVHSLHGHHAQGGSAQGDMSGDVGRQRTEARGAGPGGAPGSPGSDHLLVLRRLLAQTPRSWVWGLALLTGLSLVQVAATDDSLRLEVHVTGITVILAGLVWLPALLNVLAIGGARLKVPAGELETLGLLDFLRSSEADPLAPHEPVSERLRDLEVRYETLREVLPHGEARTVRLEAIMLQARAFVQSAEERGELDRRLGTFTAGGDGHRAVTLGLLQATTATSIKMVECVIDAIGSPRSSFEHYHALKAAQTLMPRISPLLQSRMSQAVQRAASSGTMSPTGYRSSVARQILELPR